MMSKSNTYRLLACAIRIYICALGLMSLALCCIAQTPQSSQNVEPRSLTEVKKKEGWLTPEIKSLPKTTSIEETVIDGLVVKIIRLDVPKEAPGNFDIYWLDKENFFVHSVIASMQAFFSYEHNKKIFAYSASYVPYYVNEYGSKSYNAGMFKFYYYDEDGDGIFETRIANKQGALFLPKWVK